MVIITERSVAGRYESRSCGPCAALRICDEESDSKDHVRIRQFIQCMRRQVNSVREL